MTWSCYKCLIYWKSAPFSVTYDPCKMQIFHRKKQVKAYIRTGFPLAENKNKVFYLVFHPIQGTGGWPFQKTKKSLLDYLKAIWETCYWQIAGECPGPPEASRAHHCLHGAIKGPPQLVSRSQGSETKANFFLFSPSTLGWFVTSSGGFVFGRNSFTNRNYKQTQHGLHNKNVGHHEQWWGRREIGTQSGAAGFIKPGCFLHG